MINISFNNFNQTCLPVAIIYKMVFFNYNINSYGSGYIRDIQILHLKILLKIAAFEIAQLQTRTNLCISIHLVLDC